MVFEDVHASNILINIDSHSDCLRSASLKHSARSVIPRYANVLLPNQRDPVTNGERKRSGSVPLLITEILADMTKEETKAQGFNSLEEFHKEWPKITKHPIT